jgi:hypothetical protein
MMRDAGLDVPGSAERRHHDGVMWCGEVKCLRNFEGALDDEWW